MLISICIVLVIGVALIAIPADVWSLLIENCMDQRGRLRARYVWQETRAVGNFFLGSFLLTALILSALIFGAVTMMDMYVIPADLAVKAVANSDLDPAVAKDNLTGGHHSVYKQFLDWYQSGGATKEESQEVARLLWYSLPIMVVLGFACLMLAARLTSRSYGLAMDQLVVEASARNRRKIARHYLSSTAQTSERWHRSGNVDAGNVDAGNVDADHVDADVVDERT